MPTVTDADVTLGLIDPARFAEGRLVIDEARASSALREHVGKPLGLDAAGAAVGVSEIVDESMAGAARMHAVESGADLGARLMIAFGGNGPLHATRVARRAGVSRILIPPDPGVGSAVGFLYAPVSFEIVRSRYAILEALDLVGLNDFLSSMRAEAEEVVRVGAMGAPLVERRVAFMRYAGQGHEVEIALPARDLNEADIVELQQSFEAEYRRQFSRTVPGMEIEILNWGLTLGTAPSPLRDIALSHAVGPAQPVGERMIQCDVSGQEVRAKVFDRSSLAAGQHLSGPALIVEAQTTTFVSADFSAKIDGLGNIVLERAKREESQ